MYYKNPIGKHTLDTDLINSKPQEFISTQISLEIKKSSKQCFTISGAKYFGIVGMRLIRT